MKMGRELPWRAPEGVTGGDLIRVWPSRARQPLDAGCRQFAAAKARPGLKLPDGASGTRKRRGPETYAFAAVDRVLDLVEFDGYTLARALAHPRAGAGPTRGLDPSLARFTESRARNYLAAADEVAAVGLRLEPYGKEWVFQEPLTDEPGSPMFEICLNGRRFTGNGIRELRILRPGSVHPDRSEETDPDEIATTAFALAYGHPLTKPNWTSPHQLRPSEEPVVRVRVVEIGCGDGSVRTPFDGTPDQARLAYENRAKEQLRSNTEGGDYHPGHDCPGCKLLPVCPKVKHPTGLVGIDDRTMPRRRWTITASNTHARCPRQHYYSSLHLPRDVETEYNEASRRGKAVEAWLEQNHRREPHQPCRGSDAPEPADTWSAGGWTLSGAEAALGIQNIGDHSAICPVHGLGPEAMLLPEYTAVFHDPAADIAVSAKIDLLYGDGSSWTLRETKSTRQSLGGDPMRKYPQLAVGVLLAHADVQLEGLPILSVELERLAPSGPLLVRFDPADPAVVAHARKVVSELIKPWHQDIAYEPKPGEACATCPFTAWCPDARTRKGSNGE